MNPTSEFKGGKLGSRDGKDGKDGKSGKYGMMKRYIDLLLPQKKLFFYAILSSVITTILGIASSMFNKILMDEVLPYGLNNLLVTLILVFSVVSITSTLIGFVRQWVLIHLSIKIDIPLMLGYFGHIFNLPMKFFATRKTGDITTRYSDADTIKSIFTSIALSLVMDISMAVITGIILFRMNAMLFSISLFMALVSILLVLVYKQPYKQINEESMAQSAALNSQMIESLRGIETVKCNANEQTELDNLEREYMKSLKISLRSSRISTTQGLISSFISTGFSMLTTYVGITSGAERRDDAGRLYGIQHPVQLLHLPAEQPDRPADGDPGSQHLHEASDRDHGLPRRERDRRRRGAERDGTRWRATSSSRMLPSATATVPPHWIMSALPSPPAKRLRWWAAAAAANPPLPSCC